MLLSYLKKGFARRWICGHQGRERLALLASRCAIRCSLRFPKKLSGFGTFCPPLLSARLAHGKPPDRLRGFARAFRKAQGRHLSSRRHPRAARI